ncbi:MAG: hypothetical protein U0174_01410 [Polyangiaceae bacterium]
MTKNALNLTLRRVRASIRSDVSTGSRSTQGKAPAYANSNGTSKLLIPAPVCGLATASPPSPTPLGSS